MGSVYFALAAIGKYLKVALLVKPQDLWLAQQLFDGDGACFLFYAANFWPNSCALIKRKEVKKTMAVAKCWCLKNVRYFMGAYFFKFMLFDVGDRN
jgi:hypothetical protein